MSPDKTSCNDLPAQEKWGTHTLVKFLLSPSLFYLGHQSIGQFAQIQAADFILISTGKSLTDTPKGVLSQSPGHLSQPVKKAITTSKASVFKSWLPCTQRKDSGEGSGHPCTCPQSPTWVSSH